MKVNNNIVWFTNPTKEEKLTATVGGDGKLRISEDFQAKLPEDIQFGFDKKLMRLFIAEAVETSAKYKKRKSNTISGLAKTITDTGLKLPVCFSFSYDDENNWWAGQVVLHNKKLDLEQVLALHKPLVKKLLIRMGKSTPLEDRRQIIYLAFCEAVKEYTPACGDLKKFLEDKTKCLMKSENRVYAKSLQEKSMDASLVEEGQSSFNLYSCIKWNDTNFSEAESRIMDEQFLRQLEESELLVFLMLKEKYSVGEIAERLEASPEYVEGLAKSVAFKRKQYYSEE